MKKQISLVAVIAVFISFVAFSGVASAQASNVQVVFFDSPMCSVCQQVHPLAQNAAAKYGVPLIEYDVSTATGKAVAQANSVTVTPTIIVSGAKTTRLEGSVTQAQIEAAIQQAIGTPKPTATAKPPVKAAAAKPMVKAAAAKATVKAATVAQKTAAKVNTQPAIEVIATTPTSTSSTTPSVSEFSLIGLSAPALLVGAIYLFLRRR
jgi:thiol-disulfide isomerase/thioredoxin